MLFIVCLLNIAFALSNVKAQGTYEATWESLDRHKMPQWYDDAKIGLSMHWGIYSVPAWGPREKGLSYAEWYGNRMLDKGNPTYAYHQENYGTDFTYDKFIPLWKAEGVTVIVLPDNLQKESNHPCKYAYTFRIEL